MPSIDALKSRLMKETAKRDKAAASVKKIQADITRLETQEVLETLNELNITPAEAKDLLKKAKSSILREAQPDTTAEGDAYD